MAHPGTHADTGAATSQSDAAPALDTSGAVQLREIINYNGKRRSALVWSDLTPFAQGYVEAIKASAPTLKEHRPASGGDGWVYFHWTFSDLAPETLAAILKDCEEAPYAQLARVSEGHVAVELGRTLWRERQSDKYRAFPPLTPYLGDDGKVCLREGK